jgi:DNA polymerase III subunit gamma/tau
VRAFALLTRLEQDVRLSADPRFQLEIGLVRLAELPRLRPLDEILDRLVRLEAALAGGAPARPSAPAPSAPPAPAAPRRGPAPERGAPPSRPTRASAPEPPAHLSAEPPPFFDEPPADLDEPPFAPAPPRARPAAPPPPAPKPAAPPAPAAAGLDGPEAVEAVRAKLEAANKILLLTALEAAAEVSLEGPHLSVRFDEASAKHRGTVERSRSTIETAAREVTGRTVHLSLSVGGPPGAGAAAPAAKSPKLAPTAPAAHAEAAPDPIVRAVLDTFQGTLLGLEPPADEA